MSSHDWLISGVPTQQGSATETTITVVGQDLANDLMGKVTFGELAFLLVAHRPPTRREARVFEAVLVSLAEHGWTPTSLASRLTLLSAPESIQGAVASGLLGGGSRFLGVTEDTGRFLAESVAELDRLPSTPEAWDEYASKVLSKYVESGKRVPGLGHPIHKVDPRVNALIDIAREGDLEGPHLQLYQAIGRSHPPILGRQLPLNGAGCAGAALADLGLDPALFRGFSLLARTAGLIGHLAEEQRDPVARTIYQFIERGLGQ